MLGHVLYRLSFPNGKLYFGVAKDFDARWRVHLHHAKRGSGFAVHAAIAKYGAGQIAKTIVLVGEAAYVRDMEIACIAAFQTRAPDGYNITVGGDGSPAKEQAVRDKIRASALRRWECPIYRQTMAAHSKAITHTDDQRRKNSEAKRRSWKDPVYRARMEAAHRGKTASAETKAKRSASLKANYAATDRAARMRETMTGRKFINDGSTQRQICPGDALPPGWAWGALKRK